MRHQPTPRTTVEIAYQGKRYAVSLASVHSILREGLTPLFCDVIALTADAHKISIPELMRRAVESEVAP